MLSFLFNLQDCIICARSHSAAICSKCESKLQRRRGPFCTRCGTRLLSEIKNCLRCREQDSPTCFTHSVWEYNELLRKILYQYKGAQHRYLAYFFAKELVRYVQKYLNSYYLNKSVCIVPLPANKKNIYKRGFDQSRIIAQRISRSIPISVINCIYKKRGKEQKKLSRKERAENTTANLVLSSVLRSRALSAFKLILLLDDIYTTGSTMQEAYNLVASTLQHNKAACNNTKIEGLTLSRID